MRYIVFKIEMRIMRYMRICVKYEKKLRTFRTKKIELNQLIEITWFLQTKSSLN